MTTTKILGDSGPRKSKFDPKLAEKLTKYYAEHPEALNEKPEVPPTPTDNSIKQPIGECILMPGARTYALGVHALQELCILEDNQNQPQFTISPGSLIYRPLTFKENCLARMHQFNTLTNVDGSQRTLDQRMEFLLEGNESCCGLACPAEEKKSPKFKLILQSPELIEIPIDSKGLYLPIDYSQLPYTRELDRSKSKYNLPLTSAEVDSHEGWLTLFEGDRTALRDYRKLVDEYTKERFVISNPSPKRMAFLLPNAPKEDQLRSVCAGGSGNISCASGTGFGGNFLRRKP